MDFLIHSFNSFWTSLLCIITGYMFYRYLISKRKKSYLEEASIPYYKPPPLFLMFYPVLFKVNIHEVELRKYKKCGRIYGTHEGGRPTVSVAEPELLRKILVKDFNTFSSRRTFPSGDPIADNIISLIKGEKWKRIRTIISPTFTSGKIKRMANIIINSSETVVKNLLAKAGKPINAKEYFNAFTMDVIASTAFGTKLNSFEDPNNIFLQAAKPVFSGKLSWQLIIHATFPSIAQFFGLPIFPTKTMEFFKNLTLEIIEERKKSGQVQNDFLQLLLDAEKEYDEEKHETKSTGKNIDDINMEELGHNEDNDKIFKPSKAYKALSQNELLAQCVIFFLAGFDTTSTSLTMASYQLAINPDAQEKLREEVDSIILKHGGKLTYEAIQEMKYLDNVISETLRMYPPLVRLERVAEDDYELEGTGVTIEKDTLVTIPVYPLHYDPEFYPEPEKFKPERFTPEEKATRHSYSYLTFGAGPRNCVAMRFALMEVKLCLAYMMSQLKLTTCSETKIPPTIESTQGLLRPLVHISVEKRTVSVLE